MNASSGALASIDSQVQRVRELVLQAANGTNSPSDLDDIAGEVEQLTEGVKQDAHTQYAGQYVFSGTLTSTAPYAAGRRRRIPRQRRPDRARARPRQHSSTSPSTSPPRSAPAPGAADGKLLDTLRTIAENLREGPPRRRGSAAHDRPENLENNLTSLTGLQAEAGAVTDQLNLALSRISSLQTTDTLQLGKRPGRQHRQGLDRILQRARRVRSGVESRRLDRAGVPARIPALVGGRAGPHPEPPPTSSVPTLHSHHFCLEH